MASTVIARHQCDRCHKLVEIDATTTVAPPPAGWREVILSGKVALYCAECVQALRAFAADAESVEQSR